jgi:signal transduction histidine kinase
MEPTGPVDPLITGALPVPARVARAEALLDCRILIIDDEPANVRLLECALTRAGYENYVSTTDPREAALLCAEFEPDLVLTDWCMPHFDGRAVLAQLGALLAPGDFVPIVVLTADAQRETRQLALSAGATDFLTKPFEQTEVVLRVGNLLGARLSHLALQRQNATLEACVRQRTAELERTLAELRRTQQQAIQQERLAALGTMAGGIAHDFNNALSIITGFGELLLRDSEHALTQRQGAQLETMLTAAEDAAKVVHRLREFHRPAETAERHLPVDLNQLIEQAARLTEPRWRTEAVAGRPPITVLTEPGDIPCILGDPAELREALTNLIFNAVDALPAGGTITLGTRPQGGRVALYVGDTGTGMTEEVRRRCLEPFFTTKGARGTGLGLAMVFGIIQRHGGQVDLQTAPGAGTTFTFDFPACLPEPSGAAPELGVRGLARLLHILVVDDQPVLCELLAACLTSDGHRVTTAQQPLEALALFAADSFDLVITDFTMDGLTGGELATEIKKLAPEVPILLLTGYRDLVHEGDVRRGGADMVLGKPVSQIELRHAISGVLAPA